MRIEQWTTTDQFCDCTHYVLSDYIQTYALTLHFELAT